MANQQSKKGGTALVTGASSGIGLELARVFARNGHNVILSARSGDQLQDIAAELQSQYGVRASVVVADLADANAAQRLYDDVKASGVQIDYLVNNAGVGVYGRFIETDMQEELAMIQINATSLYVLTKLFLPEMVQRGSGKILFTCSLLSFQGGITVPGYAASKGALSSLVKALANEWASKGVNVNGIAPGYISTDNTEALRKDAMRSKAILDRIPAGRWGEPADFKGPAVFLCSDAASYVNGTILLVDGGWMGR